MPIKVQVGRLRGSKNVSSQQLRLASRSGLTGQAAWKQGGSAAASRQLVRATAACSPRSRQVLLTAHFHFHSSGPSTPYTAISPSPSSHARTRTSQTRATTAACSPSYDISELPRRVGPTEPVVLWYRNDLRVDDHPGLVAAAAAVSGGGGGGGPSPPRPLAPVFLLDAARLSHLAFTAGGPEALSAALHRLRADLRARGSDLAVRVGSWEQELTDVTRSVGSRVVVSEAEVELRWRLPAAASLERASAALGAGSFCWQGALWRADGFDVRYRTWRSKRGHPAEPLPAPAQLPPFPASVEPGHIPDGEQMRQMLTEAALAVYDKESGLAEVAARVAKDCASGPEAERAVRLADCLCSPLELLRQYLGTLPAGSGIGSTDTASSVSLDDEVAALRRPGVEGAPFTGLFSSAKALGTLSVRRVFKEAYVADGRPYGSVEPQRLRRPAAVAAAVAAEAADFHRALAVLDEERLVAPGVEVHFWRWGGGLTDYCVAEPAQPLPGAPAVLLVHGFGAFGDQWRDNMGALAGAGFRVFAPTFPGFGRSQKAAMPYSQDLWRDFLRDFVLQVVGVPVVAAGNSIGGFISTCLAADYPELVRGLVLLNSAGSVDPAFNIDAWRSAVAEGRWAPPTFIVSGISSALFWYLERTVPSTLTWLYPVNPKRADEWLQREILRAAGDSGAVDVFKAAWYLPPPRALNWLISEAWRGPTLVLQGALDPLNDARSRAQQLDNLCPNVQVQLLQAGHCPHDEVPEQVNEGLLHFIRTSVLRDEQAALPAADAVAAVQATSSPSSGDGPRQP